MNVSRETWELLKQFSNELLRWNPKINLVSVGSESEIWSRHIMDSAQIANVTDWPMNWLDLGSGGGLPAIVLAIIAKGQGVHTKFHLVESDKRKCAFLQSMAIKFELSAKIYSQRIESANPPTSEVISARALTDLKTLISYAKPFLLPNSMCVFPKGKSHMEEITEAQKKWTFDFEMIKSKTNTDSAIIILRNIQ